MDEKEIIDAEEEVVEIDKVSNHSLYKISTMTLVLVNIGGWKLFQVYQINRINIFVGDAIPPLLAIGLFSMLGVFLALRMNVSKIRTLLIIMHICGLLWAILSIYLTCNVTGSSIFEIMRQISYFSTT
ncbi:MAG: hypothetical protein AAFX87_24385 [Bacteroidota bacterium]